MIAVAKTPGEQTIAISTADTYAGGSCPVGKMDLLDQRKYFAALHPPMDRGAPYKSGAPLSALAAGRWGQQ